MVEKKIIVLNLIPSLLFFLGILMLAFSPLTMEKIIRLQGRAFNIFLSGIQNNLIEAMISTLILILREFLVPLILFMLTISFGFLFLGIVNKEKFRLAMNLPISPSLFIMLMEFVFLLLAVVLSRFSYVMVMIAIGILVASLWTLHFEYKPGFRAGNNLTSSTLRIINMFFTVGIFLLLYLNFNVYRPIIHETNMEFIGNMMPNPEEIEEMQKQQMIEYVSTLSDGFKEGITQSYGQVQEPVKTQCKPIYDACISGIDSYKNTAIQEIQGQESNLTREEIERQVDGMFPIFNNMTEASPLFMALAGFFILEFLRPFVACFQGLVYALLTRNRNS